ncbi:MAG: DNRLRE domain-containing protein, partial [Candidatus Aenigmatarchaeota archaeon]
MRAEFRVSAVFLTIAMFLLSAQFCFGVVQSLSIAGIGSLSVKDDRGNEGPFIVGSKINVRCFGIISVYLDGDAFKEALGTITFSAQAPGKYTAVCGSETQAFIVKGLGPEEDGPDEGLASEGSANIAEEGTGSGSPPVFVVQGVEDVQAGGITQTLEPTPELQPIPNFSRHLTAVRAEKQVVSKGTSKTLTLGSFAPQVYSQDGKPSNLTEVVGLSWGGEEFTLSWLGYSLDLVVFAVYNGQRYDAQELKGIFPRVAFEGIIADGGDSYKYAVKISGIPEELSGGLEYLGISLENLVGLGENPEISGPYSINVNDDLVLGFADLLENFTVSIPNATTVLIGNVSGKSELLLDPTVQLQTPNTENLRDTYVYSRAPASNYGSENYLFLRDRSTRIGRLYLMFDITSIPESVSVDSAEICLYLYDHAATTSGSVYHVTDHTWDGETEATINWNNQVCGAAFSDSADCNLTSEDFQSWTTEGWICWSVTNMVQSEYSGGGQNVSMAIRPAESGNNIGDSFCSKESTTGSPSGCSAANRPYLNITFTDTKNPEYSGITQSPSGNSTYGQDVLCNATWTDNVGIGTVYFRSNYTGTWENYTASNTSSEYYYTIPSAELTGLESVGWNFWANDTSGNWNQTMPVQVFTVQKASSNLTLYLNGTDGDLGYHQNDLANFTAALGAGGFDVEIWTNLLGGMQLWDSGPSPLENITNLSYGYGSYTVKANFSGNENYTASESNHTLTISQDPVPPTITNVSPVNLTYGVGTNVILRANVTDNEEVDTVMLNLTIPGGSPQLYEMTNSTPDIYEYSFRAWQPGAYYYEIIANDTAGNKVMYDPYIYINSSAALTVFTASASYTLNEDVLLISPGSWNSSNLESGEVQKTADMNDAIWVQITYDDFESGFGSYT